VLPTKFNNYLKEGIELMGNSMNNGGLLMWEGVRRVVDVGGISKALKGVMKVAYNGQAGKSEGHWCLITANENEVNQLACHMNLKRWCKIDIVVF